MEITEVRVRLVNSGAERLRAYCSVTFDGDFVIRDLKVIEGVNGYFVAMPSRKLSYRCPRCNMKNPLKARFCSECGNKLAERKAPRDASGRAKLHVDVAHPINTACRERIQQIVVTAFKEELERSKQPDYKPIPTEETEEFEGSDFDELVAELKESATHRHQQPGRGGDRPATAASASHSFVEEPDAEPVDDEPTHTVLDELPPKPSSAAVRPAPPPAPSRSTPPAPPPKPRDEPRHETPAGANDDFAAGLF